MKIRTNRQWRQFKTREEVPLSILDGEFDHLSDDESDDGFIRYKDYWFHRSEFSVFEPAWKTRFDNAELSKWDGCVVLSAWEAVLIKLSQDGESYQIATALW